MKTFLLILFSSFMLYSQSWLYHGEMANPIAGGQTAVFNNTIYIFGGYSAELQYNIDWIQMYNAFNYSDIKYGLLPNSRYGFAGAQNDSMFYFAGGPDSFIESWKMGDTSSKEIVSFPQFQRSYPSAEIIGDKFYFIGGVEAGDSTRDSTNFYIVEYNTKDSTISGEYVEFLADDILPSQQMTFVLGNCIYILGGARNGIIKDIYRFDPTDSSYIKMDVEMPVPIAGAAVVKVPDENKVFIIGGFNETEPALSTVYTFEDTGSRTGDQIAFEITECPPLNFARSLPQAEIINGIIYVFGGFDENNNVVQSMEVYDLYGATATVSERNTTIGFKLYQNYPNPFNPATSIKYQVPGNQIVKLSVFNLLGQEVTTLVNEPKPAGTYQVVWDGTNSSGVSAGSGIYFYKLTVGNFTNTRKMIYIR